MNPAASIASEVEAGKDSSSIVPVAPELEANEDDKVVASTSSAELAQWQSSLRPFLMKFMVALAIAFFGAGVFDLIQARSFIESEHSMDIREQVRQQLNQPGNVASTPEQSIQQGLLLLEADALDKRYHQASALLMTRVWSRHLAFMTGMVLTFLGATFVLGKLSESRSQVQGGSGEWKVQVSSASPGIILCFFGTVLLMTSLIVQPAINVRDLPVYFGSVQNAAPALPPAVDITATNEKPDVPAVGGKDRK